MGNPSPPPLSSSATRRFRRSRRPDPPDARSDPVSVVLRLRAGRRALAEVLTANRAHSLVQATTADQQNINAQVAITYHTEDAEAAAAHYDFREGSLTPVGLGRSTTVTASPSALASAIMR